MAINETGIDQKIKNVDNTSPMGGGTFVLYQCAIVSPSNPDNPVDFNSKGVFQELNIYEDLFSNVLRGTFTFRDNQGVTELLPIIGDETLVLSWTTPGGLGSQVDVGDTLFSGSRSEEVLQQRFKIYDCKESSDGERSKIYKLFFVSEEYVFSTKTKISKGYKGRFYHQVVKDALNKINKNILEKYRKKTYIENTATPQNVIIPNWTPFQSINFCASRSVSSNQEDSEIESSEKNQKPFAAGSLFVFYEKLGTGFFYESIESMIINQKALGRVPLYQYLPKNTEVSNRSIGMNYFGVEKYEIKSSFKTLENLGYGMYGSKLIAYDPIRMKYDEVKYDYYEKEDNPVTSTVDQDAGVTIESTDPAQAKDDSQRIFADFIATDIHPTERTQNKLISENSDYIGSNDVSIKLATTTKAHDAMFVAPILVESSDVPPNTSIGVNEKTFKDNEAKPNQVENWLLQREMQIQEFGNIVVTFTIDGNSSRHVGDFVRFEIPTAIADSGLSPDLGHQFYSGYYIVSKIRHIITQSEYKTDLELIKNSFAKRITGQTVEGGRA